HRRKRLECSAGLPIDVRGRPARKCVLPGNSTAQHERAPLGPARAESFVSPAPARPSHQPQPRESQMASKAIVGEKVGMTQVWDEQNRLVPVTVVKIAPLRVVRVKTPESD